MKCEECGEEKTMASGPQEICCISVPFTTIEIRIWNWNDSIKLCETCELSKNEDYERRIFEEGMDCGYDKAVNDRDYYEPWL